jgi:hypothetical protein
MNHRKIKLNIAIPFELVFVDYIGMFKVFIQQRNPNKCCVMVLRLTLGRKSNYLKLRLFVVLKASYESLPYELEY